jgi:hypothetical protein
MTPFGSTADIVLADCEIPHLAHLSHSAIDRFTAGTGPSLYARNPPH